MIKIGLMGFPFQDANMGCLALTCSFLNILEDAFPGNAEIIELSQDCRYRQLAPLFPGLSFSYGKIKIKDIRGETIQNFKKCDVICDATFGDNFSDIYQLRFALKTTLFKELTLLSRTPLILAPQTYGPFSNRLLKRFAGHVIRKSHKVYSRDQRSSDYVKSISHVIPFLTTDMAFALPYQKKESGNQEKMKLGLNISGLLWRGNFNDTKRFSVLKTNYPEYISKLLQALILEKRYEIHLIPHVVSTPTSSIDDDMDACSIVHDLFPSTILAPAFQNPFEAKNYIAGMDVFTGARMHATIDAFSAGVPTIPFSYSRKFQGLYETLNYPYYVDGVQFNTDAALASTLKHIANKDDLIAQQIASMQQANAMVCSFREDIKATILSCLPHGSGGGKQ